MARITESDLFEACRFLFGTDIQLSLEFLSYLQPSGAKSAYRRKVKETHPDLFSGASGSIQQSRTEQFQKLAASYEVVCDYFKLRESGLWTPPSVSKRAAPKSAASAPRSAPPRRPSPGRHFSRGYLPPRVLQIGLYLYYRKCIDFRLLTDALMWQRRQRPNLGDIAQRWGWLDESAIRYILGFRKLGRRFGEKAVGLELLTQRQLQTLLFFQRSQQKKLGQFFVEKSVLSHEEMEKLAQEHQEHNRRYANGSGSYW
ncbi:hypothetical protein Pcar_1984 [Syntrophotalea carbinolica DSM 2380]|uniref:J domain-containing protein n=1 Tax=Syntrophotalea carbinolica (strain DSM 2380 / NBRC 103641 / GraBd1) TaxID=338963 RepID=Q3A332_SYNC1|nr:J domain-containing protein [Syntrophotalea carbinolica]ABA89225.1 hypothetical protein Pcar_1984 [Syntrophotalea carbinolica DSM 2380]